MAEGSSKDRWIINVPCRYYANGCCREGERCLYLHQDLGRSSSTSEGSHHRNLMKSSNAKNTGNTFNIANSIESGTSSSSSSSSSSGSGSGSSSSSISGSHRSTSSNNRFSNTSSINNSLSDGATDSTPSTSICRFFQRGCCMYGSNCHFSHVTASNVNSLTSAQVEDMDRNASLPASPTSTLSQDCPSSSASLKASSSTTMLNEDEPCDEKKIEEFRPKTNLRVPDAETWVNAPEFVPSCMSHISQEVTTDEAVGPGKTWAQIVNASAGIGTSADNPEAGDCTKLCPYAEMNGECPYAERCTYLHGDTCDLCGAACLHPTDDEQRKLHTNECIKQHERNMELSFAVARSRDKQCGVCFEVVMEKNPPREQRFGILPNCNHCFCLACIRKWRQAKQFENKIIRACPECRVTSDYVCPSMYWVDTKEEKEKLILDYKEALSNKQCKYFKQGRGKCPFGNKCFYLHAYPDGTKVDTGPPVRRHRQNADGEIDVLQQLFLWDFLEDRDNRWLYNLDDLDDLVALFTDSEDSELSDYEWF